MKNNHSLMPVRQKKLNPDYLILLRFPALIVLMLLLLAVKGWGQTTGDYRSKVTGNWETIGTWETYNGAIWAAASTLPGASNNVWIQYGHNVTLTSGGSCKDLNLAIRNDDATPLTISGKVYLGSYTLSVNGKIRAYKGSVGVFPGVNDGGSLSWGSTKWPIQNGISGTPNSLGLLKIVGDSRALTIAGEWGAGTSTAGSYSPNIEIALNAGQTVSLGTNTKLANWTLTSGTLDAVTFTPSADNNAAKDFTINSGAIFKSSSTGSIVQRTGSTPLGTFALNNGGTMILSGLGATTKIQATAIFFNGTVEYNAAGAQTLLTASYAGAANPNTYTKLILSGSGAKTLGLNTTVSCLTLNAPATLALGGFTLTDGSGSDIVSFNFNGLSPVVTGTVNAVNHTVALIVPSGTDKTTLVPTIALSCGASISPSSGIATDFTNPVVYTVTPGYNPAQAWTVTVVYGLSSANSIISTTIGNLVGNNISNITDNITASELLAALTLSPLATADVLSSSGGSVVTGSTSLTSAMVVRVTAEAGNTQEYTLTVRPRSNDATLASLTLSAGSLDKTFVPATLSYQGLLRAGSTTATVSAVKNESMATMVIDQATDITSNVIADRTATITVTAEDLSVKVYTIIFSVNRFLLFEPFSLPSGNLVGNGNWSQLGSGTTFPIQIVTPGLDYLGYCTSDGNESVSLGLAGQDANKSFSSQQDVVYASLLVNVTSGSTTEDYFFSLTDGNGSTAYKTKVYVKDDPANPGTKFFFGIAKTTGSTLIYESVARDYNTTYLLVIKYLFIPVTTTDDITVLWVNPTIQVAEPTSTIISTGGNDVNYSNPALGLGSVVLRQGNTTPNANKPVVNEDAASPAFCYNLTIEPSSSVTINSGKALTVEGSLNNYAGASGLVIASGASLITNGTVSGNAIVERYMTGAAESWHLLSSPVAVQSISGDFIPSGTYPDGSGYDFFTWYETSGTWVNFKNSTVAPTWSTANTNDNFAVGRGYLVEYQSANPSKQFQGSLNTGPVTYSMTSSGTGPYKGYNLVGNPYASSIDWKAASGWTRNFVVQNVGGGYDMSIWNDADGQYGTFNSDGTSGTHGVTQYIPIGQGFMVKADATGDLVMDNGIRVHNTQPFLKSAEEISNILRMKVSGNANTYSDEMVVEFGHPLNTGGAEKMFSFYESAPSLYTVKPTGNYSVDFRGEPGAVTIPVSFKAGADGNYTITASQLESFTTSTMISLEDKQAAKTQNLMQNPVYSFTSSKNDQTDRFLLHFGGTFSVNDKDKVYPVNIYAAGSSVFIANDSGASLKGEVTVFNLIGQPVLHREFNGSPLTRIDLNVKTGYYLVKVITGDHAFSSKVFVNN
ncbi:MAG: T9SS type A sorting domain-containing protein [Bacteroidetes bacterium]|nr:T9SS type A sorting domain-containing protein [Bacteroidota bacterium]